MRPFALAILLLLPSPARPAGDGEVTSAVRVDRVWEAEAVAVEILYEPGALVGAESVWLWSPSAAPIRWPADRPLPARLEPACEWLEVRVEVGRGNTPAGLKLLAAPVEMWEEVPEDSIPLWQVPENGRLRLPRNADERWRLRLVGQGVGGAWAVVPPGVRRATLRLESGSDRRLRVLSVSGDPISDILLRFFPARGREVTTAYRTDEEGYASFPALPSETEVRVLVLDSSSAPAGFEGKLSSLPDVLRLAPGAVLLGRLVDGDGKSVEGAEINVLTFQAPGSPLVVARSGVSDQDGTWRVAGLAPGKVQLTISGRGFAVLNQIVEIEAGKADLGVFELGPGRVVELSVLDLDGSTIAGAEVLTVAGLRSLTDAGGLARLENLPLDQPETATITAPGFLSREVRLDPAADDPVEVRLTPAVAISGRLLDHQGTPVGEGKARLEMGSRSTGEELRPDGSFEVELPPATAATLVLTSPSVAELRVPIAPGVASEVRDLGDLVAPRGLQVTGRLIRFDDASAVAGARIWALRSAADPLFAWASGNLLETRSDQDGRFRLSGLPATASQLQIDGPNLARRYLELAPSSDVDPLDLGEIELRPGCEVTVRTEEWALPGLQARLDLVGAWRESDMLTVSVTGDSARFAHVPSGTATLSLIRGHELLCDREIEIPADIENLTVECRRGERIVRGTVQAGEVSLGPGRLTWSHGGERLPGVILKRKAGALETSEVLWGGRPDIVVPVDGSGYFETGELRSGRWNVSWAPFTGRPSSRSLEVRLRDADEQEVRLRFSELALHGMVIDSQRQAVAGARVRELSQGAFTLSDADGSFTLSGLEAGSIELQARKVEASSDVRKILLEADRAAASVILKLVERNETLLVRVRDEQGLPMAGAFVFLEAEGSGVRLLTTDVAGTIEVLLHPPYPRRVRAAASAAGTWSLGSWQGLEKGKEIALTVAETGTVEVSCDEHCGPLRIESHDGWDVAGLSQRLGRRLSVAKEVPLVLGGLPPGPYQVGVEGTAVGFEVEKGRHRKAALP